MSQSLDSSRAEFQKNGDQSIRGELPAAQTDSSQKRVVVVLGMHRSGTSLLTSLLGAMGVDLGEKLIAGDENNEAGYWEQHEINRTQNQLLEQLRGVWQGPAWMNPRPLDWSQLSPSDRQGFKQELIGIVREEIAKAKGIWGFKDPRTSRLLPLWKEIFAEMGLEASYLLAIRHPAEVAASVMKRDHATGAHAELLWLLHNLDAVHETGDQLRLVVSYDRWFTHPQAQVRALTGALKLAPSASEEQLLLAVRQRIRPELRHWQNQRTVTVPYVAAICQLLEQAGASGQVPKEVQRIDAAVARAFTAGESWTITPHAGAMPVTAQPATPNPALEKPATESPRASATDLSSNAKPLARLVAFYLPQFHPIEENDRWWGKGFTEWTNVAQQTPRFPGHYQPQLPGELGFYDLRLPETKIAQADLARAHGIEAFCYWHYWFNGRRVLQRPFEETLASGQPDFGFCLAWANENWTRRWDGQESEILLEQTYGGEEDDRAHFESLLPAFRDARAFRIDGNPVFLVYRPASLPDAGRTAALWRELAQNAGLPGLHLIAIKTCFDAPGTDWTQKGFNAELQFQPDFSDDVMQTASVLADKGDRVVPYAEAWPLISRAAENRSGRKTIRCVTPSWDNSARRKREAFIMHNSTPAEYGRWLRQEIARIHERMEPNPIVFINAWNEWAEGNHLEPDLKWGRAYLEETRRANLGLPSTSNAETPPDTAPPTLLVKALPGPKPIEVFPVRNRSEFAQLYCNQLGPILEAQKRLIPPGQKSFKRPGHCAVCGGAREFLTDFQHAQPDANGTLQPSWGERQICACQLTSRQRACFHVLADGLGLAEAAQIYCTEQSSALFERIKSRFPFTLGSERLGEEAALGGCNSRGIRNEDLTRLTFPDDGLDAVVCLEVLAYVPDYTAALEEMARCLRPGGTLMLTTPVHFQQDKTVVRAGLGPDGKMTHHLPPVYHGGPSDAGGKLCVNDFGWDLMEDLRRAGFAGPTANFFTSDQYGYLGLQCVILASRQAVLVNRSKRRTMIAPVQRIEAVAPAQGVAPAPLLEGESTESLVARADALRQQSQWMEAGQLYRTLERRLPDDLGMWRGRIECSRNLGHHVLAKLFIKDALRNHPEWAAELNPPGAIAERPVETPAKPAAAAPKTQIEKDGQKERKTDKAEPVVSVIIPVLNKLEFTIKCLGALAKNTPEGLYEVIVWDNGSSDGTQAHFERSGKVGKAVKYFRSAENLGFVGGNNAAAQHARGRFLVLLNNDTEPQAGWLEALVQTAEADAKIGAVGAKLLYPNGQLQEAGGIIFRDGSGWNYGRTQNPRDPRFNFPREVDYCSAACLLVRAELFRELGGFDTRFAPAYYEDTDLCFALRQAGHKVVYQPRCEIIHHEGATAGQDLKKGFKQHQVTNRHKFVAKWEKVLAQQAAPDAGVVRRASHRARGERILVIDPMMPMHDRASGSKRLFEMLKLLAAAGHAVTFIARNGQNGERYAMELQALGVEVYAGDAERMKECGYAVEGWPLDLRQLLQDSQYDTVILSFWYIAEQYLARIRAWSPASRVLIDTVDVHFLRERRQAELYGDKKLLAQAAETQRRELRIYGQADGLITVTEDDRRTLQAELPGSRVFIVPNIHELAREVPPDDQRQGLLFVGGFGHLPNEDAVLYFHREIWPRVQARLPKMRWTIVGNNPPPSVRALEGGPIQVTGYVPSVGPFLRSHLISIAPLRYGAGMKGKIGEALAHGLPVVTTSIGAEGMSLKSGDGGMLVADDAETFAAHIARLHTDRALWKEQSEKGRRHVEANYTPERIGEQLAKLLEWSASLTSIIILARNQIGDTRLCLESLEKYTRPPYELILVDNNSTDGTTDFFRQYAITRNHVRVVLNRANLGFAGGNNQALSLARGDNVVLLNNDTVVTAGWLERLLSVLARQPETGLAGPVSNCISGPQRVKAEYANLGEMPSFATQWGEAHAGEATEAARLVGFCLLMRRAVLNRIGGLDTRYGNGNFEDDDLCIRANLAGFKMRIAWDCFVHHTGGQTFKGEKIDYNASLARNWGIFKAKWAMPKDAALEQGYRLPTAIPAGVSLHIALPKLGQTHVALIEGRCWADPKLAAKVSAMTKSPTKPVTIQLPPCALLGRLAGARAKLVQRKLAGAWEEALAALRARPFHPEAYLMLADIAQKAGDGVSAMRCAKEARHLAPNWKPAQRFLNGSLRGAAKHPWLVLPPTPTERPRLSVCMIVKNEEEFLGRCLASVTALASQIVVVDTGSTDRTVEIAREHGAEVHQFAWCDDFSAARNAALEHATGDWVLSLDADEELMPEQAEVLGREMRTDGVMAYRIPIVDKGHEEEGCNYVPRLFRNAPGLFFLGRLHEQAFSSIEVRCKEWGLRHELGKTRLLHHGYEKNVVDSRRKAERNLRLLESAMAELPDEPNLVMNLGLELIRAGQREEGLRRYWQAVELLGAKPAGEIVPELRETFLSQLNSHLIAGKDFAGVVKLWQTPLAKAGEMTASQHFGIGLALMELKRPSEAAAHMTQCLAKREQPVFSLVSKDILKAGPHHCLALCLWAMKDLEGAALAFTAALREDALSRPVRFDFARMQAEREKPLEALRLLNALVAENPADAPIWEFGGRVALSRVDYLAFARDWTAQATEHFPDHAGLLRQRGEVLLLTQDFEGALAAWLKADAQSSPRAMAAVVLCELLAGDCRREFSSVDEALVSQEMLKWYRRLIACGAHSTVHQLHERMEMARQVAPSYVRTWEAATRRARETMAA